MMFIFKTKKLAVKFGSVFLIAAVFFTIAAAVFVNIYQTKMKPSRQTAEPEFLEQPKLDTPLPSQYQIKNVAFTPQAPYAKWDAVHKEACEEAALFTVHYYLSGRQGEKIDPAVADKGILRLINWQRENWGGLADLTAERTGELANAIYDYDYEVKSIASVKDIKKVISQGKLVIVPAAGRELGNPYFRGPGPLYHMLVITGYDRRNFITNEIGTKRGAGYKYSQRILFNAIHDLPPAGKARILEGEKKALIVQNP